MTTKRKRTSGQQRTKSGNGRSKAKGTSSSFEVALSDIFDVLYRRLGLLMFAAVASLGLAAAYYFLATEKFESEAEILVERRDASIAADMGSGANGGDVSRDLLATHMRIIQSKKNIENAIVFSQLDGVASLQAQVDEDMTLSDYIAENLFVTSGGNVAASNAHVLNVRFRHTSPEDCQTVLDALVVQYQQFLRNQYEQDSSEITSLIDEAKTELEQDLQQLEEEYRVFRATAPVMVSGEESSNSFVQRYEELMTEIGSVDSQIAEGEARLQLVMEGLRRYDEVDAPDIQRLTLIDGLNVERMSILLAVDRGEAANPIFQAEQPERMASATSEFTSLLEKKSLLASMQETFGDNHPEVVSLQKQVNLAEEFVRSRAAERSDLVDKPILTPLSVMEAYVNLLNNDLTALKNRKSALLLAVTEAEAKVRSLVDFELQAESLLHERVRKQALYDGTVDNLRSLALSSKSGPSLIHEVLQAPEVGEHVEPNLLTAGAIAVFGMLLLGVGFVGVAELSDNSLRKSEELEEIFACPVINSVPEFSKDADARAGIKVAQRDKSLISKAVVAHHAPESRLAEIFRTMRTHLLFAIGNGAKVVCVTSAKAGEGKSTIAANLAVAAAQTGRRVLLLDCDMRRPQVAQLMGVKAAVGLRDVLEGSCDFAGTILESGIANLQILPAGTVVRNAAELLERKAFDQLLNVLREKYDLILLDCPPVLPVADTSIIAQKVDRTLIVVRIDPQSRPHSQRVAEMLRRVSVDLVGVVVNRSPCIREKYDYYSYEGYGQTPSSPTLGSSMSEVAAV